ncbi:hypothetical protein D9M68_715040 [compost metagenome]
MNTRKKKTWRKEYLRILLNGPASTDDYPLASELLDEQLAKGTYLPNRAAPNGIANLMWGGISTKGRLFADELEDQIRRSTWWHRTLVATGGIGLWLLGYCTQSILDYGKAMLFGG